MSDAKARKSSKSSLSKSKQKAIQREQERRQAVYNQFCNHYEQEYGPERWSTLIEALKQPVRHCIMLNKHSKLDPEKLGALTLKRLGFCSIPCFATLPETRFPPPSKDEAGMTDYYILDAGSVLATEALDIQPDDRVLDLCAAPGGKSLSVLQRLGPYGSLTVNELSVDRRRRLRQVLDVYLPKTLAEDMVTVTGKDGTKRYGEPEQYDKVLLDAPCSSERHLLHDEKELEQWSPKRTVHNASRQLALLKAALHSVCVGGLVVYGTCSISHVENDKVIGKILKKGKIPAEVVKKTWPIGERTKYGWIVLPDMTDGWGPLYFAVLRRTGVSKADAGGEEEDEEELDEGV